MNPTGVLVVHKEPGRTSFDVVRQVRKLFSTRKVGHTGTLDPMAEGVMVLTLGRATRIARFIEATRKSYTGTILFGQATDTYDREGTVTEEKPVSRLDPAALNAAAASLVGEIDQTVPAYSAVKVNGERLYAKARRGEKVAAPTRRVTVDELAIRKITGPEVEIACTVSKGTYIRSLAVDSAARLGLPAHLTALCRTRVGCFRSQDARRLGELAGRDDELISLPAVLGRFMPSLSLGEGLAQRVRLGQPLSRADLQTSPEVDRFQSGQPLALFDPEGAALAVAECMDGFLETGDPDARALRYHCVLATPNPAQKR